MHDIKFIRSQPNAFDAGLARRGIAPAAANILNIDETRRNVRVRLEEQLALRNRLSGMIGAARQMGKMDDAGRLTAEVAHLKESIPALEAEETTLAARLDELLSSLPNIPAPAPITPDGADENANVVLKTVGTPPQFSFTPKAHEAVGEALGLMDFAGAAKLSGARFVALKGRLARLERALGNFMLDTHTREFGFTEVSPPLLVRDTAMRGTGQLPKFAADQFKVDGGWWLIPTAEVPLTNLFAEAVYDTEIFPQRLTALTPCFRAEAGAAGRDTAGIIRQHQFYKVELVTLCTAEQAETEFERILNAAETILQRLELPYRTLALCAGDIGFSSRRTVDIEVWMPSQNRYREISSVSYFDSFQARRMGARFKGKGDKQTQFLHTLNGSGLAVGRTLAALLENFQQEAGDFKLPKALHDYFL
ncbi:MAG: serine--tRNA ligase [Holosporales bacterium]